MEIINRSKEKKAPYVWTPVPTFNTTLEKEKFFHEEFRRWREGWNGLPGMYYFHLSAGFLKTVDGAMIRPYWRDKDHDLALISEEAIGKDHDEVIIKRRGYGLTSYYGGTMPLYYALVFPGSISTLTSADTTRCKNMFTEKTLIMYKNLTKTLPVEYVPEQKFERATGYLHLKGDDDLSGSLVAMLETADSDAACKKLEGFRAKYVFLDEIFLHPRAEKVRTSAQASVSGDGFFKAGHIVMGGSCGVENEKEAQAMKNNTQMVQDMIADADIKGITVTFIPGTYCINKARELDENGMPVSGKLVSFMNNGYSDLKGAKKWIEDNRRRLEKAADKTAYWTFVKNYPLELKEVFDVNKMGIFSEETYMKLDIAKKNIQSAGEPKSFYLYKDEVGKIVTKEDKKGIVYIGKKPEEAKTYIAGIDPIPFAENKIEDGSDFAGAIKCIEDQTYDAYLAHRSHDVDFVCGQMVLMQELYPSVKFPKGAPAMLETNAGGVTRQYYKEKGLDYLLANRPKVLGEVFIDGKVAKGWYKNNEKSGPIAIKGFIDYLKVYAHLVRFSRIIDEVMGFPHKNTDVLDAMVSCELFDKAYMAELKRKTGSGKVFRQIRTYVRDEHGRVIEKWETVEA